MNIRTLHLFLLICAQLWATGLLSQSLQIADSETRNGIAYAQLGLPSKGAGTVADSNGVVEIPIEWTNPEDSVYISTLGYKPKKMIFKEVLNLDTVFLDPSYLELHTVDIKPKSAKEYVQIALRTAPYYFTKQPVNTTLKVVERIELNGQVFEENKALLKGYFVPLVDTFPDTTRIILKALKHQENHDIKVAKKKEDKEFKKEMVEGLSSLLSEINPYRMWDSNIVRNLHQSPQSLNDYNFEITSVDSTIGDTTMYITMYDKNSEKRSPATGKVVLDYHNLYINSLSLDYELKGLKVAAIKTALLVFGIKLKTIEFTLYTSYESVNAKYVPNRARIQANAYLEKIHFFRKNEVYDIKVDQHYQMIKTTMPATDKCFLGVPLPKDKHFSKAVKGDLNPELIDF